MSPGIIAAHATTMHTSPIPELILRSARARCVACIFMSSLANVGQGSGYSKKKVTTSNTVFSYSLITLYKNTAHCASIILKQAPIRSEIRLRRRTQIGTDFLVALREFFLEYRRILDRRRNDHILTRLPVHRRRDTMAIGQLK